MGVEPTDLEPVAGPSEAGPGDVGSIDHSVAEGIEALIADGKTYLEAELAFQKSRAAFTASSAKGAAIFGLGALAFLHLALIGLVVGTLLSLAASLGFVLATLIVVGVLGLGAFLFVRKLQGKLADIGAVFGDKP